MHNSSFNIVQLGLVGLLTFVCISFVVACGQSYDDKRMQSMTQLRGIHQSMIVYANSNKENYPGLSPAGELVMPSVEERQQLLVDAGHLTADYLVSPFDGSSVSPWDGTGSITTSNYSFAMLQLPEQGQRLAEWRTTLNTQAVVMSDRNSGTPEAPKSINGGDGWNGAAVWNDNRVGSETSDTVEAKYGYGEVGPDKLFESDGTDDALLIYSGN